MEHVALPGLTTLLSHVGPDHKTRLPSTGSGRHLILIHTGGHGQAEKTVEKVGFELSCKGCMEQHPQLYFSWTSESIHVRRHDVGSRESPKSDAWALLSTL